MPLGYCSCTEITPFDKQLFRCHLSCCLSCANHQPRALKCTGNNGHLTVCIVCKGLTATECQKQPCEAKRSHPKVKTAFREHSRSSWVRTSRTSCHAASTSHCFNQDFLVSQQLEAAFHMQLMISAGTRHGVGRTHSRRARQPEPGPTAWLKTSARTGEAPRRLKDHLAACVVLTLPAFASFPVKHQ